MDAAERERKTALIQRANEAYARNDLLELLALQIETEQIDCAALSNVPQARLRHYNQVLTDQASALEAEVRVVRSNSTPRQRRAVLDELPEPEEDAPDFEDLALLSALLDAPLHTPRASTRRRKRRRG